MMMQMKSAWEQLWNIKTPQNNCIMRRSQLNFGQLPLDVMVKILNYLSSTDLCKVAEVSRTLRDTATHPWLWANRGNDINKMKIKKDGVTFLKFRRFEKIKSLDLSYTNSKQTTAILRDVHSSKTLVDVSLSGVNLNQVPTSLLASGQTMTRLKKLDVSRTHLTTEQCCEISKSC